MDEKPDSAQLVAGALDPAQTAARTAMLGYAWTLIKNGLNLRRQALEWYPLPAMAPPSWPQWPCTTPTVAAEATQDADPIKEMEDKIAAFFADENRELDLRVWRFLRMRYPHQSTSISDIDRELAFERRKKQGV